MTGLFEQRRTEMAVQDTNAANDGTSEVKIVGHRQRAIAEFKRLELASGGVLGAHAVRLDDQFNLGFRENDAFPMASTFKVALALRVLQMIDSGLATFADMIDVGPALRVPPPLIENYFRHPGLAISIANLLDIMLVTSDNAATDAILSVAGGPEATMSTLQAVGVAGMRIDRSTSHFLGDFLGLQLPEGDTFAEMFARQPWAEKARLYALSEAPNVDYEDDPRDSSTPAAMTQLLATIFSSHALSDTSRDFLSDCMRRCENNNRLKGMLPPGIEVLHKTGTLGGSTSDVGIIELPYQAGRVAIAVYIKKSSLPTPQREAIIAHAARTIYDYMLFAADERSGEA
jgi:beta-lactamase class A